MVSIPHENAINTEYNASPYFFFFFFSPVHLEAVSNMLT